MAVSNLDAKGQPVLASTALTMAGLNGQKVLNGVQGLISMHFEQEVFVRLGGDVLQFLAIHVRPHACQTANTTDSETKT